MHGDVLMVLCGWCCVDGDVFMVEAAGGGGGGGGGGMQPEKQKPHRAMRGTIDQPKTKMKSELHSPTFM